MSNANGRSNVWILGVVAAVCMLAGCAHYKVTDPNSGKVYYTDDVDRNKEQGSVRFKDAKTGGEVTLQSSDVEKISKDEYEAAVGKK